MTAQPCSIIHTSHCATDPQDEHGCLLPDGHAGPHEFVDTRGRRWNWETDMECTCDACMAFDGGDWCTIYWRIQHKESKQ